jgi:glycosyltransferase involved in cell wall biosynthesis
VIDQSIDQMPTEESPRQRVAVIVPAYNAAATLGASLASVAGQRLRPSEVVVVDDGSNDDTSQIAAKWSAHLPLEVVSTSSNRGPGESRNEGVRRTTAPLVAFLDADDVWFPNHLELCLGLYDKSPGVITASGLRWNPVDGTVEQRPASSGIGGATAASQLEWLIRHRSFGIHAILARCVFEKAGGFDPTLDGVEDWDLWIRVARLGVRLQRSPNPTFLYRQHNDNLSKNVEKVGRAGLRLLDRLQNEILSEPERQQLAGAIRESRARIALNLAFATLEVGSTGEARALALRSLRGPPAIALRGAAIAVAPAWVARAKAHRRQRGAA